MYILGYSFFSYTIQVWIHILVIKTPRQPQWDRVQITRRPRRTLNFDILANPSLLPLHARYNSRTSPMTAGQLMPQRCRAILRFLVSEDTAVIEGEELQTVGLKLSNPGTYGLLQCNSQRYWPPAASESG